MAEERWRRDSRFKERREVSREENLSERQNAIPNFNAGTLNNITDIALSQLREVVSYNIPKPTGRLQSVQAIDQVPTGAWHR